MRGGPSRGGCGSPLGASTPARAGRTSRRGSAGPRRCLYPRSCGEDLYINGFAVGNWPLPPLVRGGHHARPGRVAARASTPARAGRTPQPGAGHPRRRLYPRSCGEDRPARRQKPGRVPLPPLVRGGLACTQVPGAGLDLYPRSCGEDSPGFSFCDGYHPLPPLVRGGPIGVAVDPPGGASTPARAGRTEPTRRRPSCRCLYPRSCGEDASAASSRALSGPLPPLVRGGPYAPNPHRAHGPSTPARAGRTSSHYPVGTLRALYPRSCGEDAVLARPPSRSTPLPPLVRGGLSDAHRGGRRGPSTPARAGRTSSVRLNPSGSSLYPRSCGEDAASDGGP